MNLFYGAFWCFIEGCSPRAKLMFAHMIIFTKDEEQDDRLFFLQPMLFRQSNQSLQVKKKETVFFFISGTSLNLAVLIERKRCVKSGRRRVLRLSRLVSSGPEHFP